MYLAIDPGNDTGWALFSHANGLITCGLGNPTHVRQVRDLAKTCVIEKPQIYNARRMKGDPNDLVKVAINAGEYGGVLKSLGVRVEYYTPHEWKGTQPKES